MKIIYTFIFISLSAYLWHILFITFKVALQFIAHIRVFLNAINSSSAGMGDYTENSSTFTIFMRAAVLNNCFKYMHIRSDRCHFLNMNKLTTAAIGSLPTLDLRYNHKRFSRCTYCVGTKMRLTTRSIVRRSLLHSTLVLTTTTSYRTCM